MYSNSYKDLAYNGIKELIESGLKAVRPDPYNPLSDYVNTTNVSAETWLNYSDKFVELATKNLDSSIHLNYLRLLLSLQGNYYMPVVQKVNVCLEYLLEVLRLITEQY
jgi:hypothetical protein